MKLNKTHTDGVYIYTYEIHYGKFSKLNTIYTAAHVMAMFIELIKLLRPVDKFKRINIYDAESRRYYQFNQDQDKK